MKPIKPSLTQQKRNSMTLLEVHLEIHLMEEQVEEIHFEEQTLDDFLGLQIFFLNFEEDDAALALSLVLDICFQVVVGTVGEKRRYRKNRKNLKVLILRRAMKYLYLTSYWDARLKSLESMDKRLNSLSQLGQSQVLNLESKNFENLKAPKNDISSSKSRHLCQNIFQI